MNKPILCSILCLSLGACATRTNHTPARTANATPEPAEKDTPFDKHPSESVRNAARFGGGLLGFTVGIPASIALLPITYPLAPITKSKWTGLYPFGACYYAGGALFGGVVAPFAPGSKSESAAGSTAP